MVDSRAPQVTVAVVHHISFLSRNAVMGLWVTSNCSLVLRVRESNGQNVLL
jgi:hypothetical protein